MGKHRLKRLTTAFGSLAAGSSGEGASTSGAEESTLKWGNPTDLAEDSVCVFVDSFSCCFVLGLSRAFLRFGGFKLMVLHLHHLP